MNITSRQLKAFLLTARHQSFSRAAEQLFITQSGMSVLIRELEEQLGFRLFDRTTRRVTLTEFGNKFLPIADRSLLDLEEAAASIGRSASSANTFLALGATPLLAAEFLPPAIAEYSARHPDFHIRLHDAHGTELVEMVQSGDIDVAITAFSQPAPGLRRVPLIRFSLMLIRATDQTVSPGSAVRWADIVDAKLIGCAPDNPLQQLAEQQLQRAGRRVPPDAVCNYVETQIAMVEARAGLAVMPTFAAPACRKRRISMHPLVDPVVTADLNWLVNRGRKLPRGADDFNEFLKGYLAQCTEPWSPGFERAA
jgi:LysR family transcriptional regulator, carnitine catabolism transcriptional activator